MSKTETTIEELKINYLTEEQYKAAKENGEINENEIYMTPEPRGSYRIGKDETGVYIESL